ncbi:MAG: NAD(+)/NADH kinase [Candidatus Aureabacteria bacterium]|nr:NAD(+)/NADH kinase [Candidatus Auribacterota bacterium]
MRKKTGSTRSPARTVALVANIFKKDARAGCAALASRIRRKGCRLIADRDTARLLGDRAAGCTEATLRASADLMVSVGGDGTVLRAARILAGKRVPLLGINLGGLGFLTASGREGASAMLDAALAGRAKPEERLLLSVTLERGGKPVSRNMALNDAVIAKGSISRLVALETSIDGEYLVTFVADGLIISTPTGSTAYSLSAGGPLVSPAVDAIIITPICPHTLTNRPLIVPHRARIRVRVSAQGRDSTLTLDGQAGETLRDGDEVVVAASGDRLLLVVDQRKGYPRLLREKLDWGGRGRHG